MKSVIRYALVAASLLACAGTARAQDVTVSFSGTITIVPSMMNPFPDIVVGTPFTGSYTFNTSIVDNNSIPQVGDYWHTAAPYGVTVTVGTHTFKTDPANVNFLIELCDNFENSDNFVFHSYNNLPTEGNPIQIISWQLDDPTQTALSSPAITATAPDLTKWQQFGGLDIMLGNGFPGMQLIRGHVDHVQLGPLSTPQPLVTMDAGAPAPAGYTLAGSYSLTPTPESVDQAPLRVDVYRKNPDQQQQQ
jgi:hypothetical protein